MSRRNGIAGRRDGRETAFAPVSDARAGDVIARLMVEKAELAERARLAEEEVRRLRKKVRLLEARLAGGKRTYRKGRLTAKKAVAIMADEGYVTQDGKPPTVNWVYRVNRGDIFSTWFPVGLKCTAEAFRQAVREAVADQHDIRRMGMTAREAANEFWNG